MACQFINGISWHFFYFFRQRFSMMIFLWWRWMQGEYSAERKDATFYNEMLHLCFVIIISDGLQETLEMKWKIFENYLVLYCQSKFRQPASDRSVFHRSCFHVISAVENLYFPLKISLRLVEIMTHFIIKRCMTDKLLQKAGRLGWRLQIHGAAKQDTSRQGG